MRPNYSVAIAVLLTTFGLQVSWGQTTGNPDLVGNQLSIAVKSTNSFDNSTGLYTYNYLITNSATNSEGVEFFAIQLGGIVMPDVLNATSPSGWTFDIHVDRPIVSWGATDLTGAAPTASGATPPSQFQIGPGQTLGGFSFQSHAAPGNVTYYGQGYVTGPVAATGDLDDEHAQNIPDFTQIGVNGTTVGAVSTAAQGYPNVRGFVVIMNPQQGSISSPPIQVQLKFAIDGESVNRTTFDVQLNGLEVANRFGSESGGADLQASFDLLTSPLQAGSNDLIVSVSGTDPQTGGSAVGLSRITFTVAKTIPGDVNGDGVVNCLDVAIVKTAFGKKIGQTGYDVRADVNSDGIVDIRDLAFVSQRLPAGTGCQ